MAKILCIEPEHSQIRVAVVEKKGRICRVSKCFRFLAPQGAVEDGYIRDTSNLGKKLKEELASRKIKIKKVCFLASSTRIATREVSIPMVKEKTIQSLIEANAEDYFPIDASKYVLSYSFLDKGEKVSGKEKRERDNPTQYQLMVYAAPKSISAAYKEMAECAGLTLVRVAYTGDSIYQAVKQEFSQNVNLLVKIEEKNTLITIVKDGKLALQRNVNYGVDSAVDTLRMFPVFGSDLTFEDAEDILCSRACIRSALDMDPMEKEPEDTDEFVREARREVTESLRYLIGNISRIMDYYISRNPDASFGKVLCCGLGGEVKGMERLLTNELGYEVSVITDLSDCVYQETEKDGGLGVYAALAGAMRSGINLMERTSRKKKSASESMSGAVLIFCVGSLAELALAGSGFFVRAYQQREQEHLNRRIEEERDIEDIYNAYNNARNRYEGYQRMYKYTNTPNEGLKNFVEELEEKMPSNITVETFSSTGTQVSFSMRLANKSEAANTLIQLRSFESLLLVNTTGIDEAEDGTVTMSVTCTYINPAPLDVGAN